MNTEPRIVPQGVGYALVREDGTVLAQGSILDCRPIGAPIGAMEGALAAWLADREKERRRARGAALRHAIGSGGTP